VVDLPGAHARYPALIANWDEALLEKARKGYADDNPIWMREFLGQWAADHTDRVFRYRPHVDGQPWNQWDPLGANPLEGVPALRVAVATLPKDAGTWHYVVIMDSGSRDPFACNVYAFAPADTQRRIFHVFAFERTGMYARTEAELLIGPESVERILSGRPGEPYGGIFGVIGWPDGMVIDADQAHIDELGNVYGIRVKKAEKKADYKFGAIELVNSDLLDAKIKIIKGSPLEIQLQSLQWKPDEYGQMKEDKAQANHSTDTLVYGRREIANLFESGSVTEDRPRRTWLEADPVIAERPVSLESLLAEPTYEMDDYEI
jgi:hypothetical protein